MCIAIETKLNVDEWLDICCSTTPASVFIIIFHRQSACSWFRYMCNHNFYNRNLNAIFQLPASTDWLEAFSKGDGHQLTAINGEEEIEKKWCKLKLCGPQINSNSNANTNLLNKFQLNWTNEILGCYAMPFFISFIANHIFKYVFITILLMLWTHAFGIFFHNYRFIIMINLNWFRISYCVWSWTSLVTTYNESHSLEESGHKSCSTVQFINFRNSISICSHWLCRSP